MNRDPFELLAAMAPPDDVRVAPGDEPEADLLLDRIVTLDREVGSTSEPGVGRLIPSRRRRAVVIATALTVVLAGAAGAAAAVMLLRRPADPVTLMCYSEAAVEPVIKVGLTIDPEQTPAQQCTPLWSDGTLGTSGTSGLVACVVADLDVTAVIPAVTDNACEALGWSPAAAPSPADRLDQTVADAVPDLFSGCIDDLDNARQQVEALLVDLDAADTWTVTVNGATSADRPCAANGIDPVNHVILIVAFQPPDTVES